MTFCKQKCKETLGPISFKSQNKACCWMHGRAGDAADSLVTWVPLQEAAGGAGACYVPPAWSGASATSRSGCRDPVPPLAPPISYLGLHLPGLPPSASTCPQNRLLVCTTPGAEEDWRGADREAGGWLGGWTDVPSPAELPQGCPTWGAEVLPSLELWLPDRRTGTPFQGVHCFSDICCKTRA